MSEYKRMSLDEAQRKLYSKDEMGGYLVEVEGKIRGEKKRYYLMNEKHFSQHFALGLHPQYPLKRNSWRRIQEMLEMARKNNIDVRIKGKRVWGGFEVDEVLLPEQNGELSVYEGGLEGALSVSEEEGRLSIVDGEE
ncbi:MAG: hypothetical protein Q8R53_03100 [Nanoarchaeota archaeon]|nr:hypothetical protein [Nanoarchaeota archaeon]